MLNSFPVAVIVGTLLGFMSGLGIGGGSLLILWLTLVLQMDPFSARSINLLFFMPAALVSCLLRIRGGRLKIRPLLPAIAAGCVSAGLFSWVSTTLDTTLLQKLFGMILLAAGTRELFYRERNAR